MAHPRSLRAALALPFLTAIAPAQQPLPIADKPLATTPIHQAPADPDGDYGVWAAGRDYKVSFHGDATFVPYLGRNYPHNQPWSFRTLAVTVGATPLLANDEQPARWHDDDRFEYRFGAATEAYDVLPHGLEQTFVIHQRPQQSGAIVVSGRVTSALSSSPRAPRHGALTFVDDAGRAILTYGKAVAIDARGATCAVDTGFDGERITLTVPARFVADAAFPLTIDPLVSSHVIIGATTSGGRVADVDIVRDDRVNMVTAGFTRWASASDADCWAQEWNDDLDNGSDAVLFTDITTSWSTPEIAVAMAGSPHRYCFAITRKFSDGTVKVRGHLHDSGDRGLLTNVFGIANTIGHRNFRIDVGGTKFSLYASHFMVVWQNDASTQETTSSAIHAATIEVATGAVSTFVFASGPDYERPSINQTAAAWSAAPTKWLVAFERRGSTRDLGLGMVDDQQQVDGFYFLGGQHHIRPRVAGTDGRYSVVFGASTQAQMSASSQARGGNGIEVRRVDWVFGGAHVVHPRQIVKDKQYYASARWTTGDIAYDFLTRSHWAISFLSDHSLAGTGSAFAARLGFNGALIENNILLFSGGTFWSEPPAITFDDDHSRFPTLWSSNNVSGVIYSGQVVHPQAQSVVVDGASCSPAQISWNGSGNNQQIGCEFSNVMLNDVPAGDLSIVALSLGAQDAILYDPVFAPGCRLHLDLGAPFLGVLAPSASSDPYWTIPLREALPAFTLYAQGFHIAPGTGLVSSTSRLEVPLVK